MEVTVTESPVRPGFHANLLDSPPRVGKPHGYLIRGEVGLYSEHIPVCLARIGVMTVLEEPFP